MYGRMHYHDGIDSAARSDARSAKSESRKAQTDVYFLKQEVERLLMISEALWGFIKEHHDYSDEDLQKKILKIDAADGKVDGKVKASGPKKCIECNRTLPRKKSFCIYCGAVHLKDAFER